MGSITSPNQKRVLCMNKVDLVTKKSDLLKVVEEFKDLSGYERFFMISGMKGAGVKDLTPYLIEQGVKRPWDEDPFAMSEEVMKNISLEVVREKFLDHVHQAHQDVFMQLVDLIGITSIMEVLVRLVGADDHLYPNSLDVNVMQWLADSNLLEMIVEKLNSSNPPEVQICGKSIWSCT